MFLGIDADEKQAKFLNNADEEREISAVEF